MDVVIVGGGASGALVALHLLRERAEGRRVTLVSDGTPGQGVAYSTRAPEHLLNVVAGGMSAFHDAPDHFVEHLVAEGHGDAASLAGTFVARRDYACYLETLLAAAFAGRGDASILRDDAIALRRDGRWRVSLRSGGELVADAVVLALGNRPKDVLRRSVRGVPDARIVPGWDYDGVSAIGPGERVCIAGTGLSMVDVAMTLAANGHRGPIHVVSRHGLMPLRHAAPGVFPLDVEAFLRAPLAGRMRMLRTLARDAVRAGQPWQWAMEALREHNVRAWTTLSRTDQRRFLRHVARHWDVHRHRIPPSAARTLDALADSGRLHRHRGRLAGARWHGHGIEVDVAGHEGHRTLSVDRLVDCTGLESDVRRHGHPLTTALLGEGRLRPGPHGIGIDTDASGRIRDAAGSEVPGLYTIGSARIGQLWESVAIPELRQQAAALSMLLREEFGPQQAPAAPLETRVIG